MLPILLLLFHHVLGLKNPTNNDLLGSSYNKYLHYDSFNPIPLEWESLSMNDDNKEIFSSIKSMKIERYISSNKIGVFQIYIFDINTSISSIIKGYNSRPSKLLEIESEAKDVQVSNVGGIHGYPTIFKLSPPNQLTPEVANHAINYAEEYECSNLGYKQRDFESIRTSEAWLNINSHDDYNNVHHHGGAAWSGVCYLHMPDDMIGGNLLIKPTPHPSQDLDYKLTQLELQRFEYRQATTQEMNQRYDCSYLSFSPLEGQLILFPSWLYHGVTPLNVKVKEDRELKRGKRVSLAFNIVGK